MQLFLEGEALFLQREGEGHHQAAAAPHPHDQDRAARKRGNPNPEWGRPVLCTQWGHQHQQEKSGVTKRGAEEAKLAEICYADTFLIDGAPKTSSQGSGTAELKPTDNLCFAWFSHKDCSGCKALRQGPEEPAAVVGVLEHFQHELLPFKIIFFRATLAAFPVSPFNSITAGSASATWPAESSELLRVPQRTPSPPLARGGSGALGWVFWRAPCPEAPQDPSWLQVWLAQ